MTSDSTNSRFFCLETNRHSPRIFHKNLTKLNVLDISTVNSKYDFMRSLNLFCVSNKKESLPKHNLQNFSQKNSFTLKECSVVINELKCKVCGHLIKNSVEMQYHKNLHCCLIDKVVKNSKKTIDKQNIMNSCQNHIMKENIISCNNNFITNENKVKIFKKNVYKKRNKEVTKVTLKIGGEVISKVYCKKKYLNKICFKEQRLSTVHDFKSCKNCEEITDNLHSVKLHRNILNQSTSETGKCDNELSARNISRLRKMAALLVECELQRKRHQDLEESDFLSNEVEVSTLADDAVVPVSNMNTKNTDIADDDIQEVLHVTHHTKSTDITRLQRHTLEAVKDYEIITIDDEICDNFEEDCIIINDSSPDENFLNAEENSYVFHVSNDANSNKTRSSYLQNENILTEKGELFSNDFERHQMYLKRKKSENTSHTFNDLQNLDSYELQKENEQYYDPSVQFSQFALPLRLINF